MNKMKGLLILSIVAALSVTGEAIKCYQCFGANPSCNDPFDKSGDGVMEVTFPTGCFCAKIVTELTSVTLTDRTCINPTNISRANTLANVPPFVSLSINLCATDICNGSSSISATQFGLIVLMVSLIITNWSRYNV